MLQKMQRRTASVREQNAREHYFNITVSSSILIRSDGLNMQYGFVAKGVYIIEVAFRLDIFFSV